MQGSYDVKGNVILKRDNNEIVMLSYSECLEIFATIADVKPMPFDRDEIYYQMADALELAL